MEEYPRTLAEVEARFTTEEDCPDYLIRLRWPEGFRCPRCDGSKGWPQRAVLLECADCGYQSSVTVGTVFQDTHQPLTLWFRAMWHVTSQKNGASALGLQRVLGLPISPDIAALALLSTVDTKTNGVVLTESPLTMVADQSAAGRLLDRVARCRTVTRVETT